MSTQSDSPREAIRAIVLAAGQGTRMKSDLPKVLHEVQGQAMVNRVVSAARDAGAEGAVVVVGYGRDAVREAVSTASLEMELAFAVQEEQLGTAHAVRCALPALEAFDGLVLILYGDVPNIGAATLKELVELAQGGGLALITTHVDDPTGYGRIVRAPAEGDELGAVQAIVEHKDASPEERALTEINAGLYAVPMAMLREHLQEIDAQNEARELYLTDLVAIAARGEGARALVLADPQEAMGVNDQEQLAAAGVWAAK